MQLPINRTFTVKRAGATVLTNCAALLQPPSSRSYQLMALHEIAAAHKSEVDFASLYDIREQDQLISESDATETYRVVYVERFDLPRVQYTFALVEAIWGTN